MFKPPPRGVASATKSHTPAMANQGLLQSDNTVQDLPKETCSLSPLCQIVESLTHIINGNKINATVKHNMEAIILFALKAEKEGERSQTGDAGTVKVHEICKAIKTNIVHMHNSLFNHLKVHTKQLEVILNTTSAILTGNDKLKEATEMANTDIKEVISKVSKVTVTVDKIVLDLKMYRNALLVKPTQTNKMGVNPKILSDCHCQGGSSVEACNVSCEKSCYSMGMSAQLSLGRGALP